jgi:cysteinyl-tRNA synthetase
MTTLRLYNTLTKTKEDFVPIDPANVRMYVCGPTVYDYAHIGNARPVIVFDVLFRLLRHIYGADHVTYVRNITDVDDKINARAAEVAATRNINVEMARAEITAETARQYDEDVAALGCLPPTVAPRATDNIAEMIAMIETLIQHGNAYVAEGHVLFDVSSKHDYGKLSRRTVDDMIAGARVDVAPYKKNPMDFVMWKPSDAATPGWDSPWGRGRPGWHIECSAMAEKFLGEHFDIHGGGIDLQFPHHENEIAQSEGAHHGRPFANVWMHNGFLEVEGAKMSKSLGNFVTIKEVLTGWSGRAWPGSAARWAMLQTHYRQPIDWTFRQLAEAASELQEVLNIFRGRHRNKQTKKVDLEEALRVLDNPQPSPEVVLALKEDLDMAEVAKIIRAKKKAGDRDSIDEAVRNLAFLGVITTNDVKFYSSFHGMSSDIEEKIEVSQLASDYQVARANNNIAVARTVLGKFKQKGLVVVENEPFEIVVAKAGDAETFEQSVQRSVEARNAARKAKDFKESDRIRDELLAQGIVLKDSPTGTTWEVKK